MDKERCNNCVHYPGCLTRGIVILHYFIMTGRDKELPKERSQFNARGFCGARYESACWKDE